MQFSSMVSGLGVADTVSIIGESSAVVGEQTNIDVGGGGGKILIFEDAFDVNASLDGSVDIVIGLLSAYTSLNAASSAGRRRDLEEASTSTTASCFSVVENGNGVTVGQLVGDCVSITASLEITGDFEACLPASVEIPVDKDTFTVPGFGLLNADDKSISALDVTVTTKDNDTQYCGLIPSSGVYCPTLNVEDFKTLLDDSEVDTSCGISTIVEDIVEQLDDNKDDNKDDDDNAATRSTTVAFTLFVLFLSSLMA